MIDIKAGSGVKNIYDLKLWDLWTLKVRMMRKVSLYMICEWLLINPTILAFSPNPKLQLKLDKIRDISGG